MASSGEDGLIVLQSEWSAWSIITPSCYLIGQTFGTTVTQPSNMKQWGCIQQYGYCTAWLWLPAKWFSGCRDAIPEFCYGTQRTPGGVKHELWLDQMQISQGIVGVAGSCPTIDLPIHGHWSVQAPTVRVWPWKMNHWQEVPRVEVSARCIAARFMYHQGRWWGG